MFWVTEGRIRKLYLKTVATDGFLMCPAPLFFLFFFNIYPGHSKWDLRTYMYIDTISFDFR